MIVPVPQFTAPSYVDRTSNPVQRCVNLYPVQTPDGYKLISSPGLLAYYVASGVVEQRGVYFASTGDIYFVQDNKVRQQNTTAIFLRTGTLTGSTGYVMMADNGIELFIVETTTGAKYTLTMAAGSVTAVADANCPSLSSVTFQGGYFIASKTGTGLFYLSQLLDGTNWTPVQFATAEAEGDNLVVVYSNGEHLYLVGKKTVEVWINTGNADFPFERISGATQHIGGVNAQTITNLNGRMYVYSASISGTGSVYEFAGTVVRKITTEYVESIIGQYQITGAYCIAYHSEGRDFLEISFPLDNATWVFDIGGGTWFQKESLVSAAYTSSLIRFVSPSVENIYGRPPFAFDATGNIYYLGGDPNFPTYSENLVLIRRVRVFGPIASNSKRVFHAQIRIELEFAFDSGAATTSIAPTLDWTDDGGRTYSTARTLTKTVTSTLTAQRVVLTANRLGSSSERYYRLTLIEGGKFILKKCELDLREGRF